MNQEKSERVYLSGEGLIEKILFGERDFKNIILQEDFDLFNHPSYPHVKDYLEKADLFGNPLNFSHSVLRGINFNGLALPHTVAVNANFDGTDFQEAWLYNANFSNSRLNGINAKNAYILGPKSRLSCSECKLSNFQGAILEELNSEYTNYSGSDFREAFVSGMIVNKETSFDRVNITGINGLDQVLNLGRASFYHIKSGKKEREIIKEAFEREAFKRDFKPKRILNFKQILIVYKNAKN